MLTDNPKHRQDSINFESSHVLDSEERAFSTFRKRKSENTAKSSQKLEFISKMYSDSLD